MPFDTILDASDLNNGMTGPAAYFPPLEIFTTVSTETVVVSCDPTSANFSPSTKILNGDPTMCYS